MTYVYGLRHYPIGLYKADALPFELKRRIGFAEIRTRVKGFKVPGANRTTLRNQK